MADQPTITIRYWKRSWEWGHWWAYVAVFSRSSWFWGIGWRNRRLFVECQKGRPDTCPQCKGERGILRGAPHNDAVTCPTCDGMGRVT